MDQFGGRMFFCGGMGDKMKGRFKLDGKMFGYQPELCAIDNSC